MAQTVKEFRRQSEFTMSFSLFHILAFPYRLCRFDVGYNDINVSISSSESDSEFRVMILAIADFAILQETTSQCALTLCHAVFLVLRLPAVRPPRLNVRPA